MVRDQAFFFLGEVPCRLGVLQKGDAQGLSGVSGCGLELAFF